MKRCFVIAGVMLLLLSCGTIPAPKSKGNSLVIGSIILDFTDGFFDLPPRKFETNVKLQFKNVTQGKSFTLYTSRGYFHFLTNGTDEYILEKFSLGETQIGDTIYTFGGATINFEIPSMLHKVIYIGHIVFTYSVSEADKRNDITTYFNFKSSTSVDWNKDLVVQYISDKQKNSPWLEYNIVEFGKH